MGGMWSAIDIHGRGQMHEHRILNRKPNSKWLLGSPKYMVGDNS
jgi:hypothetical protein